MFPEWLRFLAGTLFLAAGLAVFALEVFGAYRFDFVLNRMHAAALGDTLGIGFSLIGLILFSGFNFTSLKMFLVILFLWFASPVSSHLIARLEVTTDGELAGHCRTVGAAGEPARTAGESARVAGESARTAGESARVAGESAGTAGGPAETAVRPGAAEKEEP